METNTRMNQDLEDVRQVCVDLSIQALMSGDDSLDAASRSALEIAEAAANHSLPIPAALHRAALRALEQEEEAGVLPIVASSFAIIAKTAFGESRATWAPEMVQILEAYVESFERG